LHGGAASYRLQASRIVLNIFSDFEGMKDFKRLLIWQEGMEIVKKVYEAVRFLPEEERFGLRVQMTKCAVSIPSNIAEGSAKRSQKDYFRFVEIALASSFELETQTLVVQSQNWAPPEMIEDLLLRIEKEQRMISKFLEKL
jgi:four helix bundle protein